MWGNLIFGDDELVMSLKIENVKPKRSHRNSCVFGNEIKWAESRAMSTKIARSRVGYFTILKYYLS